MIVDIGQTEDPSFPASGNGSQNRQGWIPAVKRVSCMRGARRETYRKEPKTDCITRPLHGICTATVIGKVSAIVVRLRLNDNAANVVQGLVPAIQMTHPTRLNARGSRWVSAPCP